jgi:predicted membrane protein
MRCVDTVARYMFYTFSTLAPIGLLALTQLLKLSEKARKRIYALAGSMVLIGVFAMRWNVAIDGQLFSKSFLGYTT